MPATNTQNTQPVRPAIPGSTIDIQRQRAAAAQSTAQPQWTGQWQIKDNQGNVLHSFGGIGNSQADANRIGTQWLTRAGYQAGLEVEVVPEMR